MTSRYEAYMDSVSLSGLDDSIFILDISHPAAERSRSLVNIANRSGSFLSSEKRSPISVVITFEIHKYGIADRQAVCDKVVKWAGGSVLKTNDMTDKQLVCVCDQYPSVNSAKRWTDPITMTFTAYEFPYWEDTTQTTLTLTGTQTSGTLAVPGVIDDAFVEATITANAAVTEISLTVGSTNFTLENLELTNGDVVTIAYDSRKLLSIMHGTVSLLGKRTGASSDDLLAKCGKTVTFAVEADASVTVVFKVRGCY